MKPIHWIALGMWAMVIAMAYDIHRQHSRYDKKLIRYQELVTVFNADRAEMTCMVYDLYLQQGGETTLKMSAYCKEQRAILQDYIDN